MKKKKNGVYDGECDSLVFLARTFQLKTYLLSFPLELYQSGEKIFYLFYLFYSNYRTFKCKIIYLIFTILVGKNTALVSTCYLYFYYLKKIFYINLELVYYIVLIIASSNFS